MIPNKKLQLRDTARNTPQKGIILEYIFKARNHPTADMVYEAIRCKLPYVSKATVYRNLNLLAEKGIIKRIEHNGEFRFDGNKEPHHHLVDNGTINDVPETMFKALAIEELRKAGYEFEKVEITFTGHKARKKQTPR